MSPQHEAALETVCFQFQSLMMMILATWVRKSSNLTAFPWLQLIMGTENTNIDVQHFGNVSHPTLHSTASHPQARNCIGQAAGTAPEEVLSCPSTTVMLTTSALLDKGQRRRSAARSIRVGAKILSIVGHELKNW